MFRPYDYELYNSELENRKQSKISCGIEKLSPKEEDAMFMRMPDNQEIMFKINEIIDFLDNLCGGKR